MKVTVLGAGNMGATMALRLHEAGHEVAVWNRTRSRLDPLADAGLRVGDDVAAAVDGAEVAITMLTDGDAVGSIAEQVLAAAPEDAVWVQASTVGAEWADRFRALAEEHGRALLDAPVSGSTAPARSGKLTWLVSGLAPDLARVRTVLDDLGERVLHVGEAQEASRLKLIVNAWMTAATVAMADALAAADALGVAQDAFVDVLTDGPLGMPYALQKAKLMRSQEFEPGFTVDLTLKDVRLLGDALGGGGPLLDALERRLVATSDAGHGDDDLAAVVEVDDVRGDGQAGGGRG